MKFQKYVLILCLIVVLLIIIYCWPRNITKHHQGIIYDSDNFTKEVDITLNLTLNKRILQKNTVKGTIRINDEKFDVKTLEPISELQSLKEKYKGKYYRFHCYKWNENGDSYLDLVFSITKDFEYLWGPCPVFDRTYNLKGIKIAAPAKNKDEANKIPRTYFRTLY